jgi:hypothetical protein
MDKTNFNQALDLASQKALVIGRNVSATASELLRISAERATPLVLAARDKTWQAAQSITAKVTEGRLEDIDKADITAVVSVVVALYSAYVFGLVFYRLYLHPLAKFPGYKICAASEWYEFYCYIVKGGQWGNEIRKMHEKYGEQSPNNAIIKTQLLTFDCCFRVL